VGALASGRLSGRQWPAVVDQLAIADREQHDMDREDGMVRERPAVLLLHHVLELWPEQTQFMRWAWRTCSNAASGV
jgi:hypothetical protein